MDSLPITNKDLYYFLEKALTSKDYEDYEDSDRVIQLCKLMISLEPTIPTPYYYIVYLSKSNIEIKSALTKLLEIVEDKYTIHLKLIEYYTNIGEIDKAEFHYQECKNLTNDFYDTNYYHEINLAWLYIKNDKIEMGMDTIINLLDLTLDKVCLSNFIKMISYIKKEKEYKDLIKAYQIKVKFTYAFIYYNNEMYSKAKKVLTELLEIDVFNTDATKLIEDCNEMLKLEKKENFKIKDVNKFFRIETNFDNDEFI